jgi:hypothetical protein
MRVLCLPALRPPRTAALMSAGEEDATRMTDFHRGLLLGALSGFVVGGIAAYLVCGWWVTRLLRRIASDTRQLLDRTAPPSK